MGGIKDNPANLAAKEWANVVRYVFMYSEYFLSLPPPSEQISASIFHGNVASKKNLETIKLS